MAASGKRQGIPALVSQQPDRKLAERNLSRLIDERSRIDRSAGRITLAALCDRYLTTVKNRAPKTVGQKTYICKRIKSDWPGGSQIQASRVVPSQIGAFLAQYTFGASSDNAHVEVIRAIFNMALADRLIAHSPAVGLKERKRSRPIRKTPGFSDFKQIVAEVRKQPFNADARDSADFIEFLGLAGLDQAEASSLTWGDVDFDRGQIITFRHKTRTGFAIPLFPQLRQLLERLRSEGTHAAAERVFRIKDAKKAFAGACKRLGLPAYSQRALLCMFITRAIEKGVDVKVISEWQGHRDGGKLIRHL